MNINNEQVWICESFEYESFKNFKYNKFWSIQIKPKCKRCRYFFELHSKNHVEYLVEDGFLSPSDFEKYDGKIQLFSFPYINNNQYASVLDWVNKTIWYQIFIDRFCDQSDNLKNFLECSNDDYLYGGNLNGIISKLDYLKSLGINGIYLTPINASNSNHKYDVIDFYRVDDSLGNQELFKILVDESHKRGIKVMLEGVFNHVSINFFAWKDVLINGKNSKYFNWFCINQWPLNDKANFIKGNYDTFGFMNSMPKLNTSEQEVIDYISNICLFWINEYNIDSIRMDVSDEISHECIRQVRKRIKNVKSDFFILGENWHNAVSWLAGDELDSVTNYPLRKHIIDFWNDISISRNKLYCSINESYGIYKKQVTEVIFNVLDSHDTERILTSMNDINKLYQVLTFLLTLTGSPCLYYGTEVLLKGNTSSTGRKVMPWKEIELGVYNESIDFIRNMIKLRKKYESLRKGDIRFKYLTDNERVICYSKASVVINEEILIILNCSTEEISIDFNYDKVLYSRLCSNCCLQKGGILILKI